MRADAYIDSLGTVSAYELGWFRVTPLPLRCRIAGGDVLSLPQESIVVDATDSRDDDNPLFINFLKDEKPSIYSMTKSFDDADRRVQWTVPKNRRKVMERDVDIFTIITSADKMKGIEEWYLGVMIHPETSKRLLNDSVLSPIPGHVDPAGAPRTGELEYRHDHDEYLEYQ
ncbi:hypothetical protein FJT64_024022 [Amphibalanus amphitrite]|uniref:Uncharacterized protein n=1 Tax=Amphibalanus amphitrite TaxID=1232801 RepID=A0A6A4W9M4_AMPAM|nr:hypothetical protein FJT64_024022 [Amphibalanus amphitrite]